MRGADVNYCSETSGMTPLHLAIENQLSSKIVRFLLKTGANPHQEDKEGRDCCDKVSGTDRYQEFRVFRKKECIDDPKLRVTFEQGLMRSKMKKGFKQSEFMNKDKIDIMQNNRLNQINAAYQDVQSNFTKEGGASEQPKPRPSKIE